MKSIIKYINPILNFLPFNGYKTLIGVVLLIVSKLIQKEIPSAEDLQALLEALADVGVGLVGVGVLHKGAKLIDEK